MIKLKIIHNSQEYILMFNDHKIFETSVCGVKKFYFTLAAIEKVLYLIGKEYKIEKEFLTRIEKRKKKNA